MLPSFGWMDFHAVLANENRAGVLKMAGGRGAAATEVMLVPLHGRDAPGGQPVPIFAAFVASMLGGDMVRQVPDACWVLAAACHLQWQLSALLPTPDAPLTHPCFIGPHRQLLITHRLPLVFDLDETLLVAKSQSQMSKEIKALRNER